MRELCVQGRNLTNVDMASMPVHLWSAPAIMEHLGHERVDLIKMDIEGGEWPVLESVIGTPDLTSLSFELHGGSSQKWFAAYEQLMRLGFTLAATSNVRYGQTATGREWLRKHGQKADSRWSYRHCRESNYTICHFAMGEFTFIRPKGQSPPWEPALWSFDEAWQEANE